MSVPAKRRSRSKTRVSRNHKKAQGQTLSTAVDQQGNAVPHRLRGYISRLEATVTEKRAKRAERKIKAQAA